MEIIALFDEHLVEGMSFAVSLVRSPIWLAWLLEAAGCVTLERCGAILAEQIDEAVAQP